jgi:hypothetical protein
MPLSGAGAATHGGRVNRLGIEALYLALDVQTAIDEYKQVSTLLPPGTFVTYQISCAMIVDFPRGLTRANGIRSGRMSIAIGARYGLTIGLNRPVGCSEIWCSVPGPKVFFQFTRSLDGH